MRGAGSGAGSDQQSLPIHDDPNNQLHQQVNIINEGSRASEQQGYQFQMPNPNPTNDDFNLGYSQPALNLDASWNHPETSPCTIPLSMRQWIKMALESVGGNRDACNAVHSQEYRTACLKIAKYLSNQIHEAEELAEKGIFDKLAKLPTNQDWADCVYVRVQTTNGQTSDENHQPKDIWLEGLSQVDALPVLDTVAGGGAEINEDFNARVESFFGSIEANHHQQTLRLIEALDNDVYTLNGHVQNELPDEENYGRASTPNKSEAKSLQEDPKQEKINQGMAATVDVGLKHSDDDVLSLAENVFEDLFDRENEGSPSTSNQNAKVVAAQIAFNNNQIIEELAGTLQESREQGTREHRMDLNLTPHREDDVQIVAPSNSTYQYARIRNEDNSASTGRTLPVLETMKPTLQDKISYLSVETAGFSHGHYAKRHDSAAKRIYLLGLVLYELFSGGQLPHPRLYEVASSDGAFISLPKLSLGNLKNDDDYNFHNNPKRRQGPSGFNRDDDICNISCNHLKMLGIPHQLYQVSHVTYSDVFGYC